MCDISALKIKALKKYEIWMYIGTLLVKEKRRTYYWLHEG